MFDLCFSYLSRLHCCRLHAKEQEPTFTCNVPGCSRGFFSRASLLSHQRGQSHQSSLTCTRPGCGRRFAKPGLLRAHEEAHDGRKRHHCDAAGCAAQFQTASKLRRHQRVHVENKKSPSTAHSCPVCQKLFGRAEYLKTHLATHQAERSHPCPVRTCGKSFAGGALLARHMRRVHERGVEESRERLTCPQCSKRYRVNLKDFVLRTDVRFRFSKRCS
jgi:uncharacterized Zn-finger protein